MNLYWVKNITANRPVVLVYGSHQTDVNRAAREVFNGKHSSYFSRNLSKFDPEKDVLLHDGGLQGLESFNRDELQEESED